MEFFKEKNKKNKKHQTHQTGSSTCQYPSNAKTVVDLQIVRQMVVSVFRYFFDGWGFYV